MTHEEKYLTASYAAMMAEMAKDDDYDFDDQEDGEEDQEAEFMYNRQLQSAMQKAAHMAQNPGQGMDINEMQEHAALQQYLRDNMLLQ